MIPRAQIGENSVKNLFVGLTNRTRARVLATSASQSDNAAFRCDDEDNTKEEEVYQDLCAIQSSIARTRESQVFLHFFFVSY